MASVGFIVRDSDCFVLRGGMKYIEEVACVAWAETDALLHGISWASDRSLSNIIFEGNSADVINRVSNPGEDISLAGFRIRTCRSQLGKLDKCCVTWCQRHCNNIANILSRQALENKCTFVF